MSKLSFNVEHGPARVGATLKLSNADARMLLELTSMSESALVARVRSGNTSAGRIQLDNASEDPEAMRCAIEQVRIDSRNFLRGLAKRVLGIDKPVDMNGYDMGSFEKDLYSDDDEE